MTVEKALKENGISITVYEYPLLRKETEVIIDTTEHDAKIRADEVRKFAEWLDKNEHLFCHWKKGNETDIECVLREYGEELE